MRNIIVCTTNLSTPVIKFRRVTQAGHVARVEQRSSAFKARTGKPVGKILLG